LFPAAVQGDLLLGQLFYDAGTQVSKRTNLIQNMISNFEYLIDKIGYIPNAIALIFWADRSRHFFR